MKPQLDYTSEHMELVQRILRTMDYYDILEIPKNASEEAAKKAYRKLALKLHPDKNHAPGAGEAFKKLSKACQCLTDPGKKQVYDTYGDEDRMPQPQRRRYQQDSAEELEARQAKAAAEWQAEQVARQVKKTLSGQVAADRRESRQAKEAEEKRLKKAKNEAAKLKEQAVSAKKDEKEEVKERKKKGKRDVKGKPQVQEEATTGANTLETKKKSSDPDVEEMSRKEREIWAVCPSRGEQWRK